MTKVVPRLSWNDKKNITQKYNLRITIFDEIFVLNIFVIELISC